MTWFGGTLTVLALISATFFPIPYTIALALSAAFVEPLTPLAVGLLLEALYYDPLTAHLPVYALIGAVVTVVSYFVRSQLRSGIIK